MSSEDAEAGRAGVGALARALLFYTGVGLLTVPYALAALLIRPLPYGLRYRVITQWTRWVLRWLERCCALRYRVLGRERLPAGPAIILCKHQSAWETLALQELVTPQTWVLKRELLRIPLLGWGLSALEPIAIDRGAGATAMQQVVDQGRARLQAGRWVVVFPEGTRVAPGQRRRYRMGGAVLAARTGYPVVPVAHNAGSFWPRNSLAKRAGIIDLVVGPAIEPAGREAAAIMAEAEHWIETTAERLRTGGGLSDGP